MLAVMTYPNFERCRLICYLSCAEDVRGVLSGSTSNLNQVQLQDFYEALYTQSRAQFGAYVSSGTVLNNFAHIFDLLIRLRQVCAASCATAQQGTTGLYLHKQGCSVAFSLCCQMHQLHVTLSKSCMEAAHQSEDCVCAVIRQWTTHTLWCTLPLGPVQAFRRHPLRRLHWKAPAASARIPLRWAVLNVLKGMQACLTCVIMHAMPCAILCQTGSWCW